MNIKPDFKDTMFVQLVIRIAIFLLFFIGIFAAWGFVKYLLMLLIIANLVYGFINKKRSIFMNLVLLSLTFWLFIFIIEYLATVIGSVLSLLHVLLFVFRYNKGGKIEKKTEEKKK